VEDYQGKAVAKMTCSIPTCYWENATGLFASVASGQKDCPGAIVQSMQKASFRSPWKHGFGLHGDRPTWFLFRLLTST